MTTRDAIRAALAWLATYGLHSTLFLGAAWLLCTLRPPRANRNRERVWKLALVGGFVSAALQFGLGTRPLLGRFDWSANEPELAAASVDAPGLTNPRKVARHEFALDPLGSPEHGAKKNETPVAASSAPSTAAASHAPAAILPSTAKAAESIPTRDVAPVAANDRPRSAPSDTQLTRGTSASVRPPGRLERAAGAVRASWPGWVLAGWTSIGLLGLLGFALSWTYLWRHMLGREPLREGPLVERFERLRARAGVRTRARLSVSARIQTPFSTGFFVPEICLPRAVLTDLSPAQQEALLAHELAHLVRRDPAWFGLSLLIERLFFFQPLNRIARRHLSELAEVACDDWAVRWTGARLALASCLTEVAGWVVAERRLPSLPGLAGHRSRLGHRVERLLDDRRSPAGEPPTPWWPPLAAGSLALVVLAVPGVSATAPRATPATPRKVPATSAPRTSSPSLPAALPAPVPTKPAWAPTVSDMSRERGVLESELTLLETEIAALRAELDVRELSERFADSLARMEARLAELRSHHERVRSLLSRLSDPRPPTDGSAPSAAAPESSSNPRDSR